MKKLAVILVSLVTAVSGITPAQAFPSAPAVKVEAVNDVQQVRHRDRHWGGDRHWRRHGPRYYGHRHHRHRGSNAGAIIGGLAAGAIIGGALASQPRRYYRGGNDAHVQWCYARYRSYRAYDNTFQPYNGPRRQCYSPY
ncbi:BA14K family protein [Pseudorhizobium sp. NPDC055634]